jgi:acyl-homoserine lactone acylase PvdQ
MRYRRLGEVLRRPGVKYTVADFERLQHDETSLPARRLIGVLRAARIDEPELQPYLRLLREWDGVLGRDSGAAALFEIWLTKLPEAVFRQRMSVEQWKEIASRLPLERVIAEVQKGQATNAYRVRVYRRQSPKRGRSSVTIYRAGAGVRSTARRSIIHWRPTKPVGRFLT